MRPAELVRRAEEDVQVGGGFLLPQVGEGYDEGGVVREFEPRRDVAVVVQPRDDDLVAGGELPSERPGQHEVERRHVLPEADLVRRAAEKARRRVVRGDDERVAPQARLEGPAEVRVRLPQVGGHRLDHLVGRLRPARRVEKRRGPVERREAGAHGRHVERHRAHNASSSRSRAGSRPALGEVSACSSVSRIVSASGRYLSPAAIALLTSTARKLAESGFSPGASQRGRSLQASTPFSSRYPSSTQTSLASAPVSSRIASSTPSMVSGCSGPVALKTPVY